MVYAALGEKAQAMAWLERGYDERFNPGVLLRPGFDSLRADPGFRDMVNRVGCLTFESGAVAAHVTLQRAHELAELGVIQIGDGPERHAVPDPMAHLEPTNRSRVAGGSPIGRGPDEHVDRMEAPLIHERGDRLAGDVVEPTTHQRKTDGREILNRRREIQLAEEPWLHRVLIGRSHVEQVSISERADVITDDLVRNGGCGLNDLSRARESHDLN